MASVEVRADLAPMPAMRRAMELIERAGFPMHEDVAEALRVLRRAHAQAGFAADRRDNGPTERELIRGILGADAE